MIGSVSKKDQTELSPALAGNNEGEPLYEYFLKRLPFDLSSETYQKGLTCVGYTRLILGELGGREKAKIFWVRSEDMDNTKKEGHAFVVPLGANPSDISYNNNDISGKLFSNEWVMRHGEDSTEEFLSAPWEKL